MREGVGAITIGILCLSLYLHPNSREGGQHES